MPSRGSVRAYTPGSPPHPHSQVRVVSVTAIDGYLRRVTKVRMSPVDALARAMNCLSGPLPRISSTAADRDSLWITYEDRTRAGVAATFSSGLLRVIGAIACLSYRGTQTSRPYPYRQSPQPPEASGYHTASPRPSLLQARSAIAPISAATRAAHAAPLQRATRKLWVVVDAIDPATASDTTPSAP